MFWEWHEALCLLLAVLLRILLLGVWLHARDRAYRWAQKSVDDFGASGGETVVAERWVGKKSFRCFDVLDPALCFGVGGIRHEENDRDQSGLK
jgi:hypothetical protein